MDICRELEMFDDFCIETNVDIAFVLDVSSGMEPILSLVRNTSWYEIIKDIFCVQQRRKIETLRFKVIWYSDLRSCCDDSGYGESKFFVMPHEEQDFYQFLNNLHTTTCAEKTSGLEALERAMDADWNQSGDKIRHIICLFTDKSAYPLDLSAKLNGKNGDVCWNKEQHSEDIPQDLRGLFDKWEAYGSRNGIEKCTKLSVTGRRLLLFAPSTYPWIYMERELIYVYRWDVALGQGGREIHDDDICSIFCSH